MRHRVWLFLAAVVMVGGCAIKTMEPVTIPVPSRQIQYLKEVKPILDKRCVVCHSCYNSPCQLKLSSFEGVDRGATKKAVYNGARLRSMDPTRLFTDARTTDEWRKKDFFSVTKNTAPAGKNDSIMIQLLDHKMKHPRATGEYRPEADDLTCAENQQELSRYLKKHPNRGMPFGFPPLRKEEFETVAGWLYQGAAGPTAREQEELTTPKPADAQSIEKWEGFLNTDDPKHAMTSRYLYEHYFLAHIKFGTPTNEFYEMVRSRTGPGQPIDLIASVRPYDAPGVDRVYYRFRKIHSTIVYKTHMVVELDDSALERIRELFIQPPWLQTPHLVDYDPVVSANPFVAFEQIPPRSRYQFLLDNAHYVIMTFIRGPVCKGQIALNVINDHFWLMFLDPEYDLSVKYPGFLRLHADQLRMPGEAGSDLGIFDAVRNEHLKAAREFYRERQNYYASHYYNGLDYDAVWRGNSPKDTPLLTVYRHFDSASLHRGLLGNLAKTMWLIDYPLFERIYYALVAGFDIYGNVGHQLSVRLYMDELRVEGESYFLDLLPQENRAPIMQSWYKDVKLESVEYYPAPMPAGITYATRDPKREVIEQLVENHIRPEMGIAFDPLNYTPEEDAYPPLPDHYETLEDYIQAFRAVSRPGTPFFSLVNDYAANLAYLRIRKSNGEYVVLTIVINRWHDNVRFLLKEKGELNHSRDQADFIKGFVGSYPNYFLDVRQEELPDFFALLANFNGSAKQVELFQHYGVNRADNDFWEIYDWFQDRFSKEDPTTSGLFDLNRYFYRAQ